MALWRLPRPDFRRLVDTDFQDTPLALWPARSPSHLVTLSIESSDSLVASAAVSIATGWSEPVPGRELHPLKSSAFSRRTLSTTIAKTRFTGWVPDRYQQVLWFAVGVHNGNRTKALTERFDGFALIERHCQEFEPQK